MSIKGRKSLRKSLNELGKARIREVKKVDGEVRKLVAYPFNYESDDKRTPHLEGLMERHKKGEKLNDKEVEYLCSSMTIEERVNNNVCDDVRYYDLYMDHFFVKNEMQFSGQYTEAEKAYIIEKKYSPDASARREAELKKFHDEWKPRMEDTGNSIDTVYIEIRKETKEAIKKMKASLAAEGKPELEIMTREKEIILHSKGIYIKTNKIHSLLGSDTFSLSLCGEEVHIDTFSLVHILFRHFSPDSKQYNDKRSYFSPEIRTELLMVKLKEILEKIESSGHLGKEFPKDIFFKYFGRLYRIYFRPVTKSEKGRGMYKVQRVNTVYPVLAQKDINDSKMKTTIKVGKWLWVYV